MNWFSWVLFGLSIVSNTVKQAKPELSPVADSVIQAVASILQYAAPAALLATPSVIGKK